jgi:hypothetical protein
LHPPLDLDRTAGGRRAAKPNLACLHDIRVQYWRSTYSVQIRAPIKKLRSWYIETPFAKDGRWIQFYFILDARVTYTPKNYNMMLHKRATENTWVYKFKLIRLYICINEYTGSSVIKHALVYIRVKCYIISVPKHGCCEWIPSMVFHLWYLRYKPPPFFYWKYQNEFVQLVFLGNIEAMFVWFVWLKVSIFFFVAQFTHKVLL